MYGFLWKPKFSFLCNKCLGVQLQIPLEWGYFQAQREQEAPWMGPNWCTTITFCSFYPPTSISFKYELQNSFKYELQGPISVRSTNECFLIIGKTSYGLLCKQQLIWYISIQSKGGMNVSRLPSLARKGTGNPQVWLPSLCSMLLSFPLIPNISKDYLLITF